MERVADQPAELSIFTRELAVGDRLPEDEEHDDDRAERAESYGYVLELLLRAAIRETLATEIEAERRPLGDLAEGESQRRRERSLAAVQGGRDPPQRPIL